MALLYMYRTSRHNSHRLCFTEQPMSEQITLSLSFFFFFLRWSGGAKVSCILCHWGVQLILAYSWARPVILVAGKGRGNVFISFVSSLSFLFLFLPCPSLSSLLLSLFSFSGRRNKMTHKG